jgi:hypothetical protein
MTSHVTLIGSFVLAASVALGAQSPPPVNGVNGTLALEGTTNKVYRALNVVVVQTVDGVEHMIHYTKDLFVHGGKGTGVDALQGMPEGSKVVVHYTVAGTEETALEIDRVGDGGLNAAEGVVVRMDRAGRQITIRFGGDGTTETLQLTDRAAAEADGLLRGVPAAGTRIVVYYVDEGGHKIAHYLRKIS